MYDVDDGLPVQLHKIDPSQFMLSRDNGSCGATQPATSTIRSLQLSLRDERLSPRSPELSFSGSRPASRRGDQLSATYAR